MRWSRALVLLVALATFGCKTKCPDPGSTGDDLVDRDTLLRLTKAQQKDPTVCKELAHPRVSLTGPNVVLTGTKDHDMAPRASLPANEMKRIDPLFNRLKDFRELWKQLHPEAPFPGEADVVLDPEVETSRALSVLATTVFAGFPKLHTVVGPTTLDIDWAVPLPPSREGDKEVFTIAAESTDGASFDVRLVSSKCSEVAKAKGTRADLPATITKLCAGRAPCADVLRIVVPGAPRFGDAAKLAHDTLAAMPAPKPRVAIADKPMPDASNDALAAERKAFGLPAGEPCKPK